MKPTDFLSTASELLDAGRGKPRQTNLRRACSTSYYALFHALCLSCANAWSSRSTQKAWTHVYRSIEHGATKNSCLNEEVMKQFSDEIQDFANMFVQMQEKRHRADYDPNERLSKSAVSNDIDACRAAIEGLQKTSLSERRAFAAHVLLKPLPKERHKVPKQKREKP